MSDFARLVNEPRTWCAIDDLLDRGLCEENVIPILRHIAALPAFHEKIVTETPQAREERRRTLVNKIVDAALAIKDDPEAKHFRIVDHESITNEPAGWWLPEGSIKRRAYRDYPSIYGFLLDFAEHMSKHKGMSDSYDPWTRGKKTTRNDLPAFIRREIAQMLDELLEQPQEKPITAAMNLANVLLEESANYEQMKETFRHFRRSKAVPIRV